MKTTLKASNPARSSMKEKLRRQAEGNLGKRRKSPVKEMDRLRLIHELEVHQIELEMQNEQLEQARAEAEAIHRQYTDLYDFAPVGYFTLTRNGTIRMSNLTGANLLRVEKSTLVKRRFGVFVSVESRSAFSEFLEKVFSSAGNEACEIMLLSDGSNPFWVELAGVCSDDGDECRVITKDITDRKLAEEQLRYLGSHDALTGLYNRGYFMEEMARLEHGRDFPISIVVADVDHLKTTNDHHGHAAGDAALKRAAQALIAAFRAEDVVARIGGDEFAVLLPHTSWVDAQDSLQRVQQAIHSKNAAQPEIPVSLSLGMSVARNPAPLADMLREADANMYREKRENHLSKHGSTNGRSDVVMKTNQRMEDHE